MADSRADILLLVMVFLCVAPAGAPCQVIGFRGEASASAVWTDASDANGQYLTRYVPEFSFGFELDENLLLDASFSANAWWTRGPEPSQEPATGTSSQTSSGLDAYRAWARLSSPLLEIRAGLQKISFGSATLFRPLMWFDRMDPRDPLQLTEGVWAAMGRMYLPGNVTAWGWVVKGEPDGKGWELFPSLDGSAEGGGRLQIPLGPGEAGFTYNRRRFDFGRLAPSLPGSPTTSGEEDRFALDGKWDLGVGFWVEAAFARQRAEALEDQWIHAFSVGMDYTFGVGNGLTVLGEHFHKENPSLTFSESAGTISPGNTVDPGPAQGPGEIRVTSLTANYPVGVLDRLSLAVYRDWKSSEWFRLLEWRRTYDRWRFHFLAFWNPDEAALFPGSSTNREASSGAMMGRGVQIIAVFNH